MVKVIKQKPKAVTQRIKIQLNLDVVQQLKQYQEFIKEDDLDYIIQEAIKQIFEAKEFKDWKKDRSKSDTKEIEKTNEQVI